MIDAQQQRATYQSSFAASLAEDGGAAASVLDDALSPADLGASQSLELVLGQGMQRPDKAGILGDAERRGLLSRDAAAALARLFVLPMLSPELSPDPGDAAASTWDANGWSWSVAVPGFGHALHGGWPTGSPQDMVAADRDRSEVAQRPAGAGWLRSTIEYLRENRQWLLTGAAVLVALLAVGSALSKRR